MACAVGTAVVTLEPLWFNLAEQDNGKNILCDIDPTCRRLNDNEIKLAREYFGDKINYRKVRVFHRPPAVFAAIQYVTGKNRATASQLYSNLHLDSPDMRVKDLSNTDDYKTGVFLHEMTHVWQDQNLSFYERQYKTYDRWKTIIQDDFNVHAAYKYDLTDGKAFKDYGVEQAEIVQTAYRLRSNMDFYKRAKLIDYVCKNRLQLHEEKIREALPLKPTKACEPFKPKLSS